MRKLRAAFMILALALGTGAIQAQQPNQQPTAKQYKKDGSEVHLCGAPTKAGGKCKRHVKKAGELCWMHKAK